MSSGPVTGDSALEAFVLGQYEVYGLLNLRIAAMRREFAGGARLADMLVRENRDVLASDMTREQLTSALVSIMARWAQERP